MSCFLSVERGNAIELRLQRLQALGVNRAFVHAARIKVADLLLVWRVLRAFVGYFIEQLVQHRLRVVVDDVERVVARPVRGIGYSLAKLPHAYCAKLTQGSALVSISPLSSPGRSSPVHWPARRRAPELRPRHLRRQYKAAGQQQRCCTNIRFIMKASRKMWDGSF